MNTSPATLSTALEHHRAGRWSAAEVAYRQQLVAEPNNASLWHLLGVVALQQGAAAAAAEHMQRSVTLNPSVAEVHRNLALVYMTLGQLPAAAASLRQALELQPSYAEAHVNLADVLRQQGQLDAAVASYCHALQLQPQHAGAHCNLGLTYQLQGRYDAAVDSYQTALRLQPSLTEAHANIGVALQLQGKIPAAIEHFRETLAAKPDHASTHANLGGALLSLSRYEEAAVHARRAIELQPRLAEGHLALGVALQGIKRHDESVACFRRAIELNPRLAPAHDNLGVILRQLGLLDVALPCYRRALEIAPNFSSALSNYLYALQYHPQVTLAQLASAHAEYEQRFAAPLTQASTPPQLHGSVDRPLRVGLISPDFGTHPVGRLLIRAVEHLDRAQIETVCYNDRRVADPLTARFRSAASAWREIAGLNDAQVAERIRADRLDMLIELTGHTASNRLLVLARRCAPIQLTYLGYEGTTGLSAIDFILADRHTIPVESEPHYRERVVRLPDSYLCFDPPSEAPAVNSLPALGNGFITLGCCNNPCKINDRVIAAWSEILRRLPTARLKLKYGGLLEPSALDRLRRGFEQHGVDVRRLEFAGKSPYGEYLAAYHAIDLALDPFPFSGGMTTCEALWMGVSVVTLAEETFASRHGLSYLSAAGLADTVATSVEQYVECAVRWASDVPRLAARRVEQRARVAASPLCDGPRFAAALTHTLRHLCEQRLAKT